MFAREQKHVAGGHERVDEVFVLALHIADFAVLGLIAHPFQVETERLLAKFGQDDFFGAWLAAHNFTSAHTQGIGVHLRITMFGPVVQGASLLAVSSWPVESSFIVGRGELWLARVNGRPNDRRRLCERSRL